MPNIAAASATDADHESADTDRNPPSYSPPAVHTLAEERSSSNDNIELSVPGEPTAVQTVSVLPMVPDLEEPKTDARPLVKQKPKPVKLGPTFTSVQEIPPDYENVIIGAKPLPENSTSEQSSLNKKQKPESLGPSLASLPSPDYSPPNSPFKPPPHDPPTIPTISLPDYSPLQSPVASVNGIAMQEPEDDWDPIEDDDVTVNTRELLMAIMLKIGELAQGRVFLDLLFLISFLL